MCGIGCLLFESFQPCLPNSLVASWSEPLSVALERRGGDTPTREYSFTTEFTGQYCHDETANLKQSSTEPVVIVAKLLSSVLHLRGETVVPQPLQSYVPIDEITISDTALRHLALCWNGECYDLSSTSDEYFKSEADHLLLQNDTEILLGKLQRTIIDANITKESKGSWSFELHRCLSQVFGSIKGEYAFILSAVMEGGYSYTFFGRDPLGRRSLLIKRCPSSEHKNLPMTPFSLMHTCQLDLSRELLMLSSVAPYSAAGTGTDEESSTPPWIEIPPGRIFCIDIVSGKLDSFDISRKVSRPGQTCQATNGSILSVEEQIFLEDDGTSNVSQMMLATAREMYHLLNAAVRRRVLHVPQRKKYDKVCASRDFHVTGASVGILFSGGLDSVVLAALCHNHVPPNDPIDLINVAFYDDSFTGEGAKSLCNGTTKEPLSCVVPDRAAALASFREMTTRFPTRQFNFVAVDVNYSDVMVERQRILSLIKPLSTHMDFNIGSAMWFASRGLGRCISLLPEETTLLNSLRQPGSLQSSEKASRNALSSNLSRNCVKASSKKIACVNVGCPRSALPACVFRSCTRCCSGYRKKISQFLGGSATGVCHVHMSNDCCKKMKGHNNDLLNAQGEGNLSDNGSLSSTRVMPKKLSSSTSISSNANVLSGAKVLIVGIGADEQMAGYGRHRAVYKRGGYSALRSELNMEMDRLWRRNLGRDDRCISDHGREARFPFLDEDLVSFLASVNLEFICDLEQRQGVGDKMILRLVAKMIGVKQCSELVKRAIQFGSRIAKVSEANCFVSRRQASGTASLLND